MQDSGFQDFVLWLPPSHDSRSGAIDVLKCNCSSNLSAQCDIRTCPKDNVTNSPHYTTWEHDTADRQTSIMSVNKSVWCLYNLMWPYHSLTDTHSLTYTDTRTHTDRHEQPFTRHYDVTSSWQYILQNMLIFIFFKIENLQNCTHHLSFSPPVVHFWNWPFLPFSICPLFHMCIFFQLLQLPLIM